MRLTRRLVFLAVLASVVLAMPPGTWANHTDTCQSPNDWRAFVGRTYNPAGSVTGVQADIDVGSWGLCVGATAADFHFFFVDVGTNNSGCQVGGSCLIQFGIYRSVNIGTQYPWAFGGCNNKQAFVEFLGSATTTSHNFRIERDALNVFHFFLDGGQLGINIAQSDSRVSCWATGDRSADWLMEKSDFGNGFAASTSKSQFDSVTFKVTSWGWLGASSTCFDGASNDTCTDWADGDFDGWTDNGGTLAPSSNNDMVTNVGSPGSVGVPWR